MELNDIRKHYEMILDSDWSKEKKTNELSDLMTTMENAFNIPLMNDEQWNKKHEQVISLYRNISSSREF
ncbi:hypothetical protein [Halobacillus amylolyticus]|uniref:Uncharacterized protein n=1 Tax=Halobacillus amylolyticus TaxID=2932259 RepID=A0ABY4HGS9_9BACI|nr:hypothetical protein [Halobacillus amylolyticus]UOR14092.1 hypothetical protein MUO15_21285 [Halobacillus amylolyticus]